MSKEKRAELKEEFEREKRWSATVYFRAKNKAEAKDFLRDNLSGVWFEVGDFEIEEVPDLAEKRVES